MAHLDSLSGNITRWNRGYTIRLHNHFIRYLQKLGSPMGHKNTGKYSNMVIQQFLEASLLRDKNGTANYLDDTLLHSDSFDELLKTKKEVLKDCMRYNVRLNLN